MKTYKEGGDVFHVALEPKDEVNPCPFCGSRQIEIVNTWTPSYWAECQICGVEVHPRKDRKSTRLNSSHIQKSRMPSSA